MRDAEFAARTGAAITHLGGSAPADPGDVQDSAP
jgi:hypothetical protein